MSNTPGTGDAGMDMGAEQGDDFSFDDIARETLAEVVADTSSDETAEAANQADAAAQPAPETQDAPAAAETPAHWSPEEQAAFDALPPETKALVEKRTAAIEADYKDRATLGDEVKALVDTDFQKRLDASGMSIGQGIQYLANLERFATTQPAEYLAFVAQSVQGMGVDVAKVLGLGGQPAQEGQPADDGFTDPKVADLESRLARYEQNSAEQTRQRVLQDAGNQIASVRDAKDAAGNPLRPHFAKVENDMARLIKADPKMTLEQAYDAAVWSNPTVRAELQKTEREAADKKVRDDAAAAQKAARGNVRAGGRSMSPNPSIESADDAARAALAELPR